jgi:Zn-dependent peptidase ImmA (M78 family)
VPNRYRFSLSHEIAHSIVHQDVFKQLHYTSIPEWKQAVTSIPEDQYKWIEWQAYCLGGLILVPPEELETEFNDVIQTASDAGIDLYLSGDAARKLAETEIARRFEVSSQVIQRRVQKDALWAEN